MSSTPTVTRALLVLNVLVFIAEAAAASSQGGGNETGWVYQNGALFGPLIVHQHEYWRIVTSGFLHDGFLHVALNMFFLWVMGSQLEPVIGHLNFAAVYLISIVAGSFGALLLAPDIATVGASGACFGVLGALIVVARDRHIPIWRNGLGVILAINLVFSLILSNVSIGGHLGGLGAGLIGGWLYVHLAERRRRPGLALGGCILVAAAAFLAAIMVAGGQGLTPHGIGFT